MQSNTLQAFEAMKGTGKVIMRGKRGEENIDLLIFADQTWAIECAGKLVGLWEVREENECFRVFQNLCSGLTEASESELFRNGVGAAR
jgi:hypothetical protein